MLFRKRKKIKAHEEVLVLIDWDNLFLSLYDMFKAEMRIEGRIEKMMDWVKKEIGEPLGGYGFVFAPEHLSVLHQDLCVKNNLRLVTCPKKRIKNAKEEIVGEEDTVDETLIWFAKLMMDNPGVGFLCLVSGDEDYVPLMEEAARRDIKRVLVAPTVNALSKSGKLVSMADKHPVTGKKMILRLDAI